MKIVNVLREVQIIKNKIKIKMDSMCVLHKQIKKKKSEEIQNILKKLKNKISGDSKKVKIKIYIDVTHVIEIQMILILWNGGLYIIKNKNI
jgi:hypothetical protein